MHNPAVFALVETCLWTVAISLTVGLVISWRRDRRKARLKRVRREIAETQRQLQSLAFRHDAALRAQAHEARKALIMESFRASKEAPVSAREDHRCTNHNGVSERSKRTINNEH
ncbi:MAG: LapA family protein [Actinobacteria bacterium]|nr:LapA family protein [Actinomycetota bacterium]